MQSSLVEVWEVVMEQEKMEEQVKGVNEEVVVKKDGFEEQYSALASQKVSYLVDAVLKRPAEVAHGLIHGDGLRVVGWLSVVLLVCLAGLGAMMGSFSGGAQFWLVPLKVGGGTLLSAVICLPSLYILLCLSGSEQRFPEVAKILLLGLALAGLLFVGFMPVAWIFSQATESVVFMGVLYLLVWGVGLYFGLRLLKRVFSFLNGRSMGPLNLWIFIFVMVLLQMSTTLRPILGEHEVEAVQEKLFFLGHWFDLLAY